MTQTLLIGAEGFRSQDAEHRLKCCPWSKLANIKNMSDFDTVVVCLLTLPAVEKLDVNAYDRLFTLKNMAEILTHQGRILIVGDPRRSIRIISEQDRGPVATAHLSPPTTALGWTRFGIEWDDRSGESINDTIEDYVDRNAYGRYLSYLKQYGYSIDSWNPDKSRITEEFDLTEFLATRDQYQFWMEIEYFLKTRYGSTIAGAIRMRIVEADAYNTVQSGLPVIYSELRLGPFVLLPPVNLSDSEAIQIILEDACGIDLQTEEPEWVSELVAPGQESIDAEIVRIDTAIDSLLREKEENLNVRSLLRMSLRLLYAQHHDLEDEVRSALKALGAQVEHDENSSGDDGWLTVDLDGSEYQFVLEVKGTTKGSVNEYGLKQLDGWVSDGISARGIRAKALLVVNASAAMPVHERQYPFGGNFMRNAELRGAVVIRSQDLFECLSMYKRGKLNLSLFWKRLFDHTSVASAEELCPPPQ